MEHITYWGLRISYRFLSAAQTSLGFEERKRLANRLLPQLSPFVQGTECWNWLPKILKSFKMICPLAEFASTSDCADVCVDNGLEEFKGRGQVD